MIFNSNCMKTVSRICEAFEECLTCLTWFLAKYIRVADNIIRRKKKSIPNNVQHLRENDVEFLNCIINIFQWKKSPQDPLHAVEDFDSAANKHAYHLCVPVCVVDCLQLADFDHHVADRLEF